MSDESSRVILLTGATGYVGGRLLGHLEQRGCRVRCLTRRPDALRARVANDTEVAQGDMLDAESAGLFNNTMYCIGTCAVSGGAFHILTFRPASVSIHNK